MKSKFFTLLLCLLFLSGFAQKRNWNWVFGQNAGISFNTGAPVPFAGSAISTQEGCASISDTFGVLQFYTDGITVWNRNHIAMTNGNGLQGGFSSSQSAIIVPKPDSINNYYIFTTDGGFIGLSYSEVDMTLNGGFGDVTSVKNVPLIANTTEKLTAGYHTNGHDVWVVTHISGSDAFYSYLVTSVGVSAVPVITNVGHIHNGVGCMKISPDRTKLALGIDGTWAEFFDFNSSTGAPSNPIYDANFPAGIYGVEFSPNSQYVYIDEENGANPSIYQYDMLAGSPAAVLASRVTVTTSSTAWDYYSMQIAPDGKIYVASYQQNYIHCINNPNGAGLFCGFQAQAVTLSPGTYSRLGLPQYFDFTPGTNNFYAQNFCFGDTTWFSIEQPVDSALWDFGDASTGTFDSSTLLHPYHIFSAIGTFSVTLYAYNSGIIDTITNNITINGMPQVNLGNDTAICVPGNVGLNATTAGATYQWSTGATAATITVNSTGTYSVTVNISGCRASDTIIVSASSGPVINLGNDTSVCIPDTLTLHAFYAGATYLWSNGSHADSLNVFATGTYGVTVLLGSCVSSDAINITEHPKPPASVTANQTVFCSGDTALICANSGMSAYLWNTGETTMCITTGLAGNYYVLLTDSNGCSASSNHLAITVYTSPPVSISVNGDTLSSYNASTYQWFLNGNIIPGATSQTYIATQGGSYTVEVTDTNGCNAFSTAVVISGILTPTLSQDEEAISVYPNPNSVGSWQLTVGKELLGSQFEIFDDRGRLVLISNIEQRRTNIELNVARGIYLLKVSSAKNVITRKLVRL